MVKLRIPPSVQSWLDENQWTDPFYQDNRWWGFAPGAVIPTEVPNTRKLSLAESVISTPWRPDRIGSIYRRAVGNSIDQNSLERKLIDALSSPEFLQNLQESSQSDKPDITEIVYSNHLLSHATLRLAFDRTAILAQILRNLTLGLTQRIRFTPDHTINGICRGTVRESTDETELRFRFVISRQPEALRLGDIYLHPVANVPLMIRIPFYQNGGARTLTLMPEFQQGRDFLTNLPGFWLYRVTEVSDTWG